MEVIALFLFLILMDFFSFCNRKKEEDRIYKRTVEDVNWNRDRKCNCRN